MPSADWSGSWGADPRDTIVTPEAVRLDLQTVGVGSRSIAFLLDFLVLSAFNLGVFLIFAILPDLPGTIAQVLFSILVLFNVIGYHLLSELAMDGQTWGKRRQKLRVVMADGSSARTSAIVIRNLVRIIDFLPASYAVGIIAMITNTRSQRLGDLAAQTIVVRERKHAAPLAVASAAVLPEWSAGMDVSAVDDRDYTLARGWVSRRHALEPAQAHALALQVGNVLRERVVGIPEGIDDPTLIPVVVALVQQRGHR